MAPKNTCRLRLLSNKALGRLRSGGVCHPQSPYNKDISAMDFLHRETLCCNSATRLTYEEKNNTPQCSGPLRSSKTHKKQLGISAADTGAPSGQWKVQTLIHNGRGPVWLYFKKSWSKHQQTELLPWNHLSCATSLHWGILRLGIRLRPSPSVIAWVTTVAGIIKDVCEAIWHILVKEYMPPSNRECWRETTADFKQI